MSDEQALYVVTEKSGRQLIGRAAAITAEHVRLWEPLLVNDGWQPDKQGRVLSNVFLLSLSSVEVVEWVDIVEPVAWRPAGEALRRFYDRALGEAKRNLALQQSGVVPGTPENEAVAKQLAATASAVRGKA